MLKIIDWYIIRKFLGTFLFIIILLMAISVVFDVSEKLDDFLKTRPSINEILGKYYLNYIIYYGNLFSPLIIFIALIWFTSQMAQKSEIIAIISSGVSFNRLLRPFFIAASILAIISLVLNHYFVPIANKTRLKFEEDYIRNEFRIDNENHHAEISPGQIAYFQRIDYGKKKGNKFSLENWESGALKSKLIAESAKYDSISDKWQLEKYLLRKFDLEGNVTMIKGNKLDTVINLDMSDFGIRTSVVSSMTYNELDDFINAEIQKGSSQIPFYLVDKYQRTSYPIATYILTLIGVSIASRKVRGGIGVHIAIGVIIAVSYIFAMRVATVAATNAGFDPFIAVWMPNSIFFLIAVYLYFEAPK